jgi:hypothetical protein
MREYCYINRDRSKEDIAKIMNMFHWCNENISKEDFDWSVIFSSSKFKFEFNNKKDKMLFALT